MKTTPHYASTLRTVAHHLHDAGMDEDGHKLEDIADDLERRATLPEALPLQCPWALTGSHMCRESFAAREEGRGSKKLRYPVGDPRNSAMDDPYEATLSPQLEKKT